MKIGIIGVGHIGKILTQRLSAAGHDVKVANSRGPETIDPEVLAYGGRAVAAADAVEDGDIIIISAPLSRLAEIAPHIAKLPAETVVIDTSNYYPQRDGRIEAIDAGQVESLSVAELMGRPVVKAWNAIGSESLIKKARPVGAPDSIAIPVAADRERDRRVGMALVEETGLDAVDAGTLADSWRQQPGSPCYRTDLALQALLAALKAADAARLPKRRDLSFAALVKRLEGSSASDPVPEFWWVQLNRALFM